MKKKVRITKNNIELLKIIHGFRYLPFKVLLSLGEVRKMYSFRQSLHYAVLQMEKRGLIKSFLYGNNEKVVYLSSLGAVVLSDCIGEKVYPPNRGKKISYAGLEHTVKITAIFSELFNNFKVTKWLGDQQIFCQYKFTHVATGKKIERNLSPDGYFVIEIEGGKKSFFLEYDTGTMDLTQLALKFRKYFEYFSYGDWREKFIEFPNVFFITQRDEKLMSPMIKLPSEDISKFVLQRDNFIKSRNVIYKGIGLADNIKSMNSNLIRDYLKLAFIFTYTHKQWIEELKKYL